MSGLYNCKKKKKKYKAKTRIYNFKKKKYYLDAWFTACAARMRMAMLRFARWLLVAWLVGHQQQQPHHRPGRDNL